MIDGILSEWVGVPVLADPKYAIPKGAGTNGTYVLFEEYNRGSWTGPDDQTSAVQVVWDVENLYIGIVVTDDYHENSANSPWNGDSAQLMIANATRNAQIALYTGKDPAYVREVVPLPKATSVAFDSPVRVSIQDGANTVDAASVKLTVDGTLVNVAATKAGDLTTIEYKPSSFWASGSSHSASISFTAGTVSRTESWYFTAISYATLTKAHQAVSVDTAKPGFLWNVFQNETVTHTTLAQTELALAGQLTDPATEAVLENWAEPGVTGPALAPGVKVGPLYRFEIPTVINLSQTEGELNGYFTPDEQMPGIPGTTGMTDGIDAEVITFVELPAGVITMGVVSDDGFRVQAGYINVPDDGLLLWEVDNSTANVTFRFAVQDAGFYPIRTIWQEGGGGAHLELCTLKADGTRVLINDTASGGYKSYRSGVAPNKPVVFSLAAQLTGGAFEISWTEPGVVLQESTDLKAWADVPNATSPYRPTLAGTPAKFYRLKK